MDRAEVEGIVNLAIARYHSENVTRLTRIEDRIIGIDGNGTGRKGALQTLGDQVGEINANVKVMLEKDQQKEGARKLRTKWTRIIVGLGSASIAGALSLIGLWAKHKMGW